MPDLAMIRCIGQGAYGQVWLARSVVGAMRAVKVVHRQPTPDDRRFEREFEGLKYRDISTRTGLSVSNVGYRLHHILKELARKLRPLGIDETS